MDNYLKSYDMLIHTKSPVFVGSGRKLSKKEYIFLRDKKKVLIPDLGLLYSGLCQLGMRRRFEEYVMSGQRELTRIDLNRWLRENRVAEKQYRQWIRYELDCGDYLQKRGEIQILEFQKDAYGMPYVPGTTLKGMLRTILLTYELLKNNGGTERLQETIYQNAKVKAKRKYYLKREQKEIEVQILHKLNRKKKSGEKIEKSNAVNDCLSGLIISDSKPIPLEDLVLCQKVDEDIYGKQNALNLLRESVKPNRNIQFQLTIDAEICPYTIDEILEAVRLFGEVYYEMYLSHFENGNKPEEHTVWLGGGTGFFTKTVLYPLLGQKKGVVTAQNVFRNTLTRRQDFYRVHKHDQDRALGVSPHMLKCTRYQDKWYHMGECKLSVCGQCNTDFATQ